MSKILAAYGGGFKPPTAGHFKVVQTALNKYPEIDEFIIYVGSGERNGISQTEAILIWDIFANYLPMKVRIEPSKAPIGDIIRLGKNNLDDEVYFVIGGREGREDDLEDINSRTKNIETAYPNMKVKVITTPDRGMSGTNARKAAKESEKELTKYLPKILSPEEKLEIFNIMRPVVKETLNEGRYDQEILMQSRYIVNQFKNSFGEEYEDSVEGTFPDLFDSKGEPFYYDLDYRFIPSDIDVLGPLPYIIEANGGKDGIEICIQYDPSSFPEAFNELIAEIKDSLRHELEHVSQFNLNKGFDMKNINQDDLPFAEYITLDYEIPAFVQGLYKRAKTKKIPLSKAINDFFDDYAGELSDDEEKYVRKEWGKWIKANLNVIKENKNLNEKITQQVPNVLYHATYKALIPSIKATGLDTREATLAWEDSKPGIVYLANDPGVAESYAEESEEVSDEIYDSGIVVLKIPTKGLDINKLYDDRNVRSDEPSDTYEYHGQIPWVKISYSESLNENATYSQTIDVKEKIAALTDHMIEKGYNIEPLPTVEFIDGDSENASNFLGKTAYYDPDSKTIALYTEGRHPKDITRSYAHELIHHIQNLEGRLGDIRTTNTLEDDNLDKLEQEANLKGTMTFRNWTDSLNEDKDYFGLNKAIKEIIEEPKYKIFSDMDGVLTDFDEAFKKVSNGIPPREYEKKFGKDKFWELIDGGGVDYWVEMPYMPDGKQYWDYIKDYDTELLSSPSRSSTSRLGKRQWVENNMPGVKLTLAQAYLKRNYAAPNHILIDDRKSNIEEWRANGGIGILHTSAADTISQLKKLGL